MSLEDAALVVLLVWVLGIIARDVFKPASWGRKIASRRPDEVRVR